MAHYPFHAIVTYRADDRQPWLYEGRDGATTFFDPGAVGRHIERQLVVFRQAIDGAREYYFSPKPGVEAMAQQLKRYPDWIHEAEVALVRARAHQATARAAYSAEKARVHLPAARGEATIAACQHLVATDPGTVQARRVREAAATEVNLLRSEYDRRRRAYDAAKREHAAEMLRLRMEQQQGEVVDIREAGHA